MSRKLNSVQVVSADTESAPGDGVFDDRVSVGVDVLVGAVATSGPGTTRASRHPAPIGNLGIRTQATRHNDDTGNLERTELMTG